MLQRLAKHYISVFAHSGTSTAYFPGRKAQALYIPPITSTLIPHEFVSDKVGYEYLAILIHESFEHVMPAPNSLVSVSAEFVMQPFHRSRPVTTDQLQLGPIL